MIQSFTVPGTLPALNEIIASSKKHWSTYAKEKKAGMGKVMMFTKRLKPMTGRVAVTCTWYCPDRRKDPDNIAAGGRKCLLDGLVETGVLAGDGWRNVSGFSDRFCVDRENPRVEVTLEEKKDE